MARHHPFEEAEVASLEYLPFDVRRKLDLAGLHVSLACWQALSLQDRGAWCDQVVSTPVQIADFGERVRRDTAGCVPLPRGVPQVDPDMRPWDQPQARDAIVERASLLDVPIDAARWLELAESPRYALYRLADARKSADKFVAALREFGLAVAS